MSADKHPAEAPSHVELFAARMRVLELEETLRKVRAIGLLAGAGFVLSGGDQTAQCREFLDTIDAALASN
jgi:hypothetical protein